MKLFSDTERADEAHALPLFPDDRSRQSNYVKNQDVPSVCATAN
jgi:hypothetical protein